MNPTTTTTPIFPVCSSCGEHRGLNHDSARCWTIARAFADVATLGQRPCPTIPESSHHITQLSRWLADRPAQRGNQPYRDRQTSLDRWIALAQRQAGGRQ
jgi:hypothetical protein